MYWDHYLDIKTFAKQSRSQGLFNIWHLVSYSETSVQFRLNFGVLSQNAVFLIFQERFMVCCSFYWLNLPTTGSLECKRNSRGTEPFSDHFKWVAVTHMYMTSGDSLVVERQTRDRKVSGLSPGRSGGRFSFLFHCQLSVLTLISVSVPHPCYRSST